MKIWLFFILTTTLTMSMAQNSGLPSYKYQVKYEMLYDSIQIAYVEEGDSEAPTLLMVHGLGGYIKNWYPNIDELKKDYRCIAIDLPGYGLSTMKFYESRKDDYLGFFASVINDFAIAFGLQDVTLIGHSMGGQISIRTALSEPEWMSGLVLAAPAGFEVFSDSEAEALIQYGSAEAITSHDESQIRAAYAVNFVDMPSIVEEMIQDRLKAKEQPWFDQYAMVREMGVRGMLGHPVKNNLKMIKYPTLVLFGTSDLLIPNRYFHKDLTTQEILNVGRQIPDATLSLISEAGHMLQMDNAQMFNQSIIKFTNHN